MKFSQLCFCLILSLPVKTISAESCTDLIKGLEDTPREKLESLPFITPPSAKDAYEKTNDYNKRVKAEYEKKLEAATQEVAKSFQDKPVRVMVPLGWSGVDYNPDKEIMKVKNPVFTYSTKTMGSRPFQREMREVVVSSQSGDSRPYKLGVSTQENRDFRVAYVTKLQHPFITGKSSELTMKVSPEKIKKIGMNQALILIGKPTPPYSDYDSGSYDNWSAKTVTKRSSKYAAIDVSCAGLISLDNEEIVTVFK